MMSNYFKLDSWATKFLGINSYICDIKNELEKNKVNKFLNSLNERAFITIKIPTQNVSDSIFLQENNFKLIDTLIKYSATPNEVIQSVRFNKYQNNLKIREANNKDIDIISKLASISFKSSRFNLDPYIDNQSAKKLKYEWARNFFKGNRGDNLFIAESKFNRKIIGFILMLDSIDPLNKLNISCIDLIAVDSKNLRKGIALSLIKYASNFYKSKINSIHVGTQAVNITANRLYQKLNFKTYESKYIFHYHKK